MFTMQRQGDGRRPLCTEEGLLNLQGIHGTASPAIGHPHLQNQEGERAEEDGLPCFPCDVNAHLVDHTEVKLLGRVEGGWVTEETPSGKKKSSDEYLKPSKKKSSSKPTSEDLKSHDNKWTQRFA